MRLRWMYVGLAGVLLGALLAGCRQKTVEEQVQEALSKAPPASEQPKEEGPMTIDPHNPPSGPSEAVEKESGAVQEKTAADEEKEATSADDQGSELPSEEAPATSGE